MNKETLAWRLGELYAEYKASGQSIDDFMKAKLELVRGGGEAAAEEAIRTFAAIDANFADLQKSKADGENRQEWLRRRLHETLKEVGAEGEREKVGAVLASVVDVLKGEKAGTTPVVPFEDIDATDTVARLDEALGMNALMTLCAAEKTDGLTNGTED